MRRCRWTSLAAALAIAAGAAVSAGCGSGSSNALSLDPVAAAATKTQHAGAARIRFALDFRSSRLRSGKTLHLGGTGAIDGTSGEFTIHMGSLIRHMGIPPEAMPNATTTQLMHGSIKEIFLRQNGDFVVYLRVGALSSYLGGKQWIALNLSKLGNAAGLGQLLSGSQVSPGDLLSMLQAEGTKVRNLGAAKIEGVAATHYRVTVEVAKAMQAKGLASPLLRQAAAKMRAVPADVWISKGGLVRRIRFSFGLARRSAPLHLGMTMDIYDYGAHITIAAPPSSDVFDVTQLAQQGISGFSH